MTSTIQEWLLQNEEDLIQCPYQLGRLKITKSSCRKQRQRAGDWAYTGSPDNYIHYFYERHLEVCRRCDRLDLDAFGFTKDSKDLVPEENQGPQRGRAPKKRYRRRARPLLPSKKPAISP